MKIDEFERRMPAFSLADHQRVQTYLRTLARQGLTVKAAQKYVAAKKAELAELEKIARENSLEKWMPRCPKCRRRLTLRPVLTPKGRANVHGWRSCFECPNCAWEKYSRKRPEDAIRDLSAGKKEV
jgi:uncharacterized protein with PIN domain